MRNRLVSAPPYTRASARVRSTPSACMRAAYCKARAACGLRRTAHARYKACVSGFDEARDTPSIDRLAAALGCKIEPGMRAALAAYVALVASWNRKLNLTAAREADAQVEVLLGDACVL